ncbi:NAD(P)-dependent oxidoreductase [Nonomuraea sp. NPDC051191]|uniref:NAD(P)-dependent oxidoreductase n=1 Tax=Nonomuraea sp. NPDC051191 TaxID=3364372 RepID=UPI0037A609B5
MTSLAVIAATGRTGRLVVERALAAGHTVTAIARRPGELGLDHPRLVRRADAGPVARLFGRVLHHVMRHPYADMARMEQPLSGIGLTWTAVRPTGLTDRPGAGRPRVSIGATERLGARTSRADLAAFIVDHLGDPRTHHLPVAVSS